MQCASVNPSEINGGVCKAPREQSLPSSHRVGTEMCLAHKRKHHCLFKNAISQGRGNAANERFLKGSRLAWSQAESSFEGQKKETRKKKRKVQAESERGRKKGNAPKSMNRMFSCCGFFTKMVFFLEALICFRRALWMSAAV